MSFACLQALTNSLCVPDVCVYYSMKIGLQVFVFAFTHTHTHWSVWKNVKIFYEFIEAVVLQIFEAVAQIRDVCCNHNFCKQLPEPGNGLGKPGKTRHHYNGCASGHGYFKRRKKNQNYFGDEQQY